MKLSIPVAIVGSMLVATLTAGIAWGLNKERLDAVTESVTALKANKEATADRLKALEVRLDYIKETLERVEKNTRK